MQDPTQKGDTKYTPSWEKKFIQKKRASEHHAIHRSRKQERLGSGFSDVNVNVGKAWVLPQTSLAAVLLD